MKKECKKHQWDYVGNFSMGPELVMAYNPKYARFVCPYCNRIKNIKIREGEEKHGM